MLKDNEKCSKMLLFRRMGRAEEDFLFCTPEGNRRGMPISLIFPSVHF